MIVAIIDASTMNAAGSLGQLGLTARAPGVSILPCSRVSWPFIQTYSKNVIDIEIVYPDVPTLTTEPSPYTQGQFEYRKSRPSSNWIIALTHAHNSFVALIVYPTEQLVLFVNCPSAAFTKILEIVYIHET